MSATPVSVFNATPAGSCGLVCNVSNALTTNGASTGLDCDDPSSAVKIDGVDVTACVAADFGAVVNLDPVIIRAGRVANACGRACTDELCDTGLDMSVFYGNARGMYQWAGDVRLMRLLEDHSLNLNVAAQFVVICRGGSGSSRDDIVVDSIRTGNACP